MLRLLAAGLLAIIPVVAHAQTEQQQLVDRASLAAQDLVNERTGQQAEAVLRQARAVVICPRVLKAGFLFGGEGGDCVLVARDAAGSWSSPAFYGLGGASFGFQAGLEDAEVMLMIMTDRGLRAIMDTQLKLGASAGLTFVDLGGGVQGATTTALTADIVGFSRARGLYAGIALSGSILSAKSLWDQVYYGRPVGTPQIVISMEANNPGADPLREILSRYGSQVASSTGPVPLQPSRPYMAPQPQAPVQQQALPPPRR
jgi:lipid-binding SYLF domain-containing protein